MRVREARWGLAGPPGGCVPPHGHPEARRASSPGPAPLCPFSASQGLLQLPASPLDCVVSVKAWASPLTPPL